MEQNTRRFKTLPRILFLILLIINNVIAIIFLRMPFIIGLSTRYLKFGIFELILKLCLFGLILSGAFSVISLSLNYFFKDYYNPPLTGQMRFFVGQMLILFSIFMIIFSFYFILPAFRS